MNVALWLVQVVLALTFLVAGARKSFLYEQTRSSMRVLKDLPRPLVRFIGVCEMLGALGLLLPEGLAVPFSLLLTSLAASGLALLMVLATAANARRGEPVALNVILLALAGFVACGPWIK